jgi:hypothetical protein
MDRPKLIRLAYIALAVAATVFVGGAIVGYLDCGPGRNACKTSGEVTGTKPIATSDSMVRVTRQDRHGAIDLLAEHRSHQKVRPGLRAIGDREAHG